MMVTVQIYDNNAIGQDVSGLWPVKEICVSSLWLDEYVKKENKYKNSEEFLSNYTLDEVVNLEEDARKAGGLVFR